jgi:hypothetical protein
VKTFTEYVAGLPWIRGSLDSSSYSAFLRAVSLGVSDHEAMQIVADHIRASGSAVRMGKLRHQLNCAAHYVKAHPDEPRAFIMPARPLLEVNHRIVRDVARRVRVEITPEWLRRISPTSGLLAIGPVEFLRSLFLLGEHVVTFTNPRSQGRLWSDFNSKPDYQKLDYLRHGHQGVWYMIQPVDGYTYHNPRSGHESRRSEESVTAWRYAILESDRVQPEKWLKILVQLPLPIAAIYSSGGESIHALIRVDARSKVHWDQLMRGALLAGLSALGADPKALTAIRLSRLPQCMREETGKLQELFYLNPQPEPTPLWTE